MLNNFCCHTCNARLIYNQDSLDCLGCGKKYPVIENIPVFIGNLNIRQTKNKLYTDKLFDGGVKQDKAGIKKEYYEKISPRYFKQFGEGVKFKRVLDLGCGDGFLTLNLLQYEDSIEEIYGLDVSFNTLLSFRKNIFENRINKKIILICSAAEELFLPDNYFDAVVCQKFIHHMPLGPLLKEVHRALKPGGYFISFREPHMNYSLTYFKRGYYTSINFISFIINTLIRHQKYSGEVVFKVNTKKFLYPTSRINDLLKKEGFSKGTFSFSSFLFPFTKVMLQPFYLKFPALRPRISSMLEIIRRVDSLIFERIIPKQLLQEVSFYSRKL